MQGQIFVLVGFSPRHLIAFCFVFVVNTHLRRSFHGILGSGGEETETGSVHQTRVFEAVL